MDLCRYVNVFHGCEEMTPEKPEGIAAKWFFIKAQCGNTSPAATLPFGGMSAAPFTGGYPTGYTDHLVNTHAKAARFENGKKLLGFTHLQQSGTGYIGYFYNYVLVTPGYGSEERRRDFYDEKAKPGYYSCKTGDILCELTSDERTSFHRYTFGSENGKINIDFSACGLDMDGELKGTVGNLIIRSVSGDTVTAGFSAEGVNLYFAVKCNGRIGINGSKAAVTGFGKQALLRVSLSLVSVERALEFLNDGKNFDTAEEYAYNKWNEALSRFKIEVKDEKIKRIFYSNLYHSLVKPIDRSGDGFIYDGHDFMTDFATLWDMYKTAIPLIFLVFDDIAEKTVNTLESLCDKLGFIPNTIGLTDDYKNSASQARTLGCFVLMTAYRYGIKTDARKLVKTIEKDIFAKDKTDFTLGGRCRLNSWTLDMAECCALCADIADEIGEKETACRLRPLGENCLKCYDKSTGLLSADSEYYEGTLYNYSFRLMKNMDKRIEIAGGKERFVSLLDKFFGYAQPDRIQPYDPADTDYIEKTMEEGIFEGFNNEPDTEAPFSYIAAGRHNRTCEIIRSGMKYMFTEGRGGIPGNNDSGALSSYYVFSALGIFPVAGQDLFYIGSPLVDSAEISLACGKTLSINVVNNSPDNIYVRSVRFNGETVKGYSVPAHSLTAGGVLEIEMTDNKSLCV
ncbi:MAG: glycoside hydrolase family 92 protein [Clostridia bacterium]|nr:glycoside hydrolase family 92 protein [Clostridia bacterium]